MTLFWGMIENHLLIVQNIESILHMNEKDWYMEQFPAIMIFVISIKKGIKLFYYLTTTYISISFWFLNDSVFGSPYTPKFWSMNVN